MRVADVVVVVAALAMSAFGTSAVAEPVPDASGARMSRAQCLTNCADDYRRCVQRKEGKQPGICGGDALRCRGVCPPKVAAVVPPEPVAAPASGGTSASIAGEAPSRAPSSPESADRSSGSGSASAARESNAGAIAPANVERAMSVADGPGAVPQPKAATAAGTDVPPSGATGASASAKPAQHAVESAAAAPAARRRRMFGDGGWCLFGLCIGEAEAAPRSCVERCSDEHTDCVAADDKQRPGKCAREVIQCKDACAAESAGRAR